MSNVKILGIWFSQAKESTPVKKREILYSHKSFEEIYNSFKTETWNKDVSEAEKIYEKCFEAGINVLGFYDDFYPPLLRKIPDPPPVLYKKGLDIDYRKYPLAGVVGSRLVSDYGKGATQKISRELSQCGFIVVSGMAAGVDGIAHRSVISRNGLTVAVLGCGADIIYPLENTDVYEKLCENGAILTEYPPGEKPTKTSFPKRNRIISGMSHAIVVTEARFKSGSLITANTANKQKRKVFAVPQNINSPYGQGTNEILKTFATVITEGNDVYKYYKANESEIITEDAPLPKPRKKETVKPKEKPVLLNVDERRIIEILKGDIKSVDELCEKTGFSMSKVVALMTMLEIKGVVYSVMGNSYGLKL